MTRHNLIQHPLSRSLAVLAATTLLLVVIRVAGTNEPSAAALPEPYAPFRMTYIIYEARQGPVTMELTWRGQHSWEEVVVASPEREDSVGNSTTYDRGTVTFFDSVVGITMLESDCTDDYAGATRIPRPWLLRRAYLAEEGWEALGRDADSYDRFQRVIDTGERQFKELHRRDPATRLAMEIGRLDDSGYVPTFQVLSYAPLMVSQPGPYACEDLAPTPTPWATEVADPP